MLSKKVKINLNYNQQVILETLSNEHRLLYNFLLDKVKKETLDFSKINENYKLFRKERGLTINSKSAQNTSICLINNIKSYLALKKKDKTAKFPKRFKGHKYFTTFMLDYNKGCGGFKLNDNKIELNLNSIKNKLIIDLPEYAKDITNGNIKTVSFLKEDNDYFISFVYQETTKIKQLDVNNFLSIDLGFSRLVTGCSKVENIVINNYKQKKLNNYISELQSIKDKLKKGSRKYKKINKSFKRNKKKLVNKQKDFQHKSSRKIVDFCVKNNIGKLIVGDINVKSIIKESNYNINGLSKSTTGLGRFKTFLEYKSKNEGIKFVLVNEAYTSKINCLTGNIEFDSSLKNREFVYENIIIDRDLNSCLNILKKSGLWLSQDSIKNLLLNKLSELK